MKYRFRCKSSRLPTAAASHSSHGRASAHLNFEAKDVVMFTAFGEFECE